MDEYRCERRLREPLKAITEYKYGGGRDAQVIEVWTVPQDKYQLCTLPSSWITFPTGDTAFKFLWLEAHELVCFVDSKSDSLCLST